MKVGAVLVAAALLSGHSWYHGWCCDDRDCSPIDETYVTVHANGDVSYLHCKFKKEAVRHSQDDKWHVCMMGVTPHPMIFPDGSDTVQVCRCIYRPLRGF